MIIGCDGFDCYGTTGSTVATQLIAKGYTLSNTIDIDSAFAGVYSNYALRIFSGVGCYCRIPLSSNYSTLIATCFWKSPGININTATFLGFYDSGSIQVAVRYNKTNSKFEIVRGTTVIATSTNAFSYPPSVWHWISLKVNFHNSTGSASLQVNGTEECTFSGNTIETANAYANQVYIGCFGSENYTYSDFDDLIIMDTSGSSYNNHIGQTKVVGILPTADGYSSSWTATGAASDYLCVNEQSPNGDTDYITSTTPGNISSFTFPACGLTSIGAVKINSLTKLDAPGTRTIRNGVRISTTNYEQGDYSVPVDYTYNDNLLTTSPATASAWTPSEVDGAEFFVKDQA